LSGHSTPFSQQAVWICSWNFVIVHSLTHTLQISVAFPVQIVQIWEISLSMSYVLTVNPNIGIE
jgi:hypothetical protein